MNKSDEKFQNILKVTLIVLLNIAIIAMAVYAIQNPPGAESTETLSKLGSRGDEVTQIQTNLKNWGYYNGNVDGIYGEQTRNAVIAFQQKNGLTADGVAGPQTLAALGISGGGGNQGGGNAGSNESEVQLLARLISAESRGEPYIGQVAVGAVILNRVKHPSFPDTIAGVAYQPGAFTAMTDGQINEAVADSAVRAANEALAGSDPSGGAIYYFNPDKTSNAWMHSRPVIKRIGNHLFCS